MSTPPRRPLPPLRAVQAFEAAQRRGSFALAAAELNVTPSAISHQIQILEQRLGLKLFERHAGGTSATPQAEVYGAELSRALDAMAAATEAIAPIQSTRELVLLSGYSFASRWLQPRLAEFKKNAPEARIRIQTFSRIDELSSRSFDIAISYGEPRAAGLKVEPLLTERIVPLCSPSLRDREGLRDLSDLGRITLIHSDNALGWESYLHTFDQDIAALESGLWLDRSVMALEAAADGQGVVLESLFLARRELEAGTLVTPFDVARFGLVNTSYYIVFGRQYRRNPLARQFRAWLRDEISIAISDSNHGDSTP